jgi:hypothetical protein
MKKVLLFFIVFFTVTITLSSCAQTPQPLETAPTIPNSSESLDRSRVDLVEQVWVKLIPEEGTDTTYGIPLSIENTEMFIDWHYSLELSSSEREIIDAALDPLAAPCCDDYPIRTC